MPDITMCSNNECPQKANCYRFMAEASPFWQSYSKFELTEDGKCNYFWKMEDPK